MSARRAGRRARKSVGWVHWWPFLLALVATPFAVRAASVMALTGPAALRALYPFVVLVQAHAPGGILPEQRDAIAQGILWAQFPVYGLLIVALSRWRGFFGALVLVALLHGAAVLAAMFLR